MRDSSDRIWNSITSNNPPANPSGIEPNTKNQINKNDQPADLIKSSQLDQQPLTHVPLSGIKQHLVAGYTEIVLDRVRRGWSCHLLTNLFPQLPGPRPAVMNRMKDQAQRMYSILVTRINRKPSSATIDELPILIGAVDLPVAKNSPSTGPLVRCNDGLHFHAVLLIPRHSRLKTSLAEHFEQHSAHYTGSGTRIQRIHVKPVVESHERVIDYVLKTITNGRLSYDDAMLVLPRARQELAD
jgi:hypothetical protein